eukprot:13363082-Alexandrium_andersonii.AAC.1
MSCAVVLGQAWDVADISFSPVDLGVPPSRSRKYMVAIRRQGRVRWRQGLGGDIGLRLFTCVWHIRNRALHGLPSFLREERSTPDVPDIRMPELRAKTAAGHACACALQLRSN